MGQAEEILAFTTFVDPIEMLFVSTTSACCNHDVSSRIV